MGGLPGGGPGLLGRIGPVTPLQARQLATAAVHDPAAQWRIIITNAEGQAIAVTRTRGQRSRAGPGPARDGPPRPFGLVGRVTLTISQDTLDERASGLTEQAAGQAGGPGPPPGGSALAAVRAAIHVLERAPGHAPAD